MKKKLRASKVKKYKVWIHIEGLNREGDCIEGDDYYEPFEVCCVDTIEDAQRFRNALCELAEYMQDKWEFIK